MIMVTMQYPIDGTTLVYDDMGAGPEVLLLHGIMADRTALSSVAESLSATHRVLNVDLRGHGDSDVAEDYELASFAHDIAALLLVTGLTRPTVVGWSMGGSIAMDLALRYPEIMGRLVLVGSTPCLVQRADWATALSVDAAAGLRQLLATDWREGATAFTAQVVSDGDAMTQTEYRRMALRAREDVTLACFDSVGAVDLRARLGNVHIPAATIVGGEDRVCPPGASEYLARELGGTHHVIVDAGHAPFLTRHEEFMERLRPLL